jgi:hypothetical protein
MITHVNNNLESKEMLLGGGMIPWVLLAQISTLQFELI